MKLNLHYRGTDAVTVKDGARSETFAAWHAVTPLLTVRGGRLNTVPAGLSFPAGAYRQRADGQWILDLTDVPNPRDVAVTGGVILAEPKRQRRGFCSGEVYMLPRDAQGRLLPLPGQRHRKIYVSAAVSPATYPAMDQAAIAAHWNAANGTSLAASSITGTWLVAHPEYGGSPALPVTDAVRALITGVLWGGNKDSRSDWVLHERGYAYPGNFGSITHIRGESENHPIVIGAYGTGDRPSFTGRCLDWLHSGPCNLLARDLDVSLFKPKHGKSVILENCVVSGSTESQFTDMAFATFYEGSVTYVYRRTPLPEWVNVWPGSPARISGAYSSQCRYMLWEGALVAYNGYGEGYDFARSLTKPQSMSYFNHGLYLTYNSSDINLFDNLIAANASSGTQIRTGGHFEGNIYADNNYPTGGAPGGVVGFYNQYQIEMDQIVFGAGYKNVSDFRGSYKDGFNCHGPHMTRLGGIVAHLANPDDPAEIAARKTNLSRPDWDGGSPYGVRDDYVVNEVQVYRWRKLLDGSWINEGVEGLNDTTLAQTTLQRRAATIIGTPTASVKSLVTYLAEDTERLVQSTVRDISAWTKARFGKPLSTRTAAANIVFQPHPACEGFRWDNRRNWTTQDLPGRNVADTVDLDGWFVRFGRLTAQISGMVSKGGKLDVTSGKLTVGTTTDAADIAVRLSGALDLGATTQPVRITTDSGLTRMTGAVSNLDLIARGHSQVLLGPDATVPAGKKLIVSGQRPMVGWDGTGSATLTVAGTLEFRAGCLLTMPRTLALRQYEIFTGTQVSGPTFDALIADFHSRGDADINRLWLCDVEGLPAAGQEINLGRISRSSDGYERFEDFISTILAVTSWGISPLQRFRSGAIGDGLTEPTVNVSLVLAAGMNVTVPGRERLTAGASIDLTGPGITVTDQGATLPAGVSVTNGKLVLVV